MEPPPGNASVSLEKHLNTQLAAFQNRLDAADEAIRQYFEARIEALDRATSVAGAAMETRLEGMNEFRQTLRDQAGSFVTRKELKATEERIEADLRMLRESKALLEGKASQRSVSLVLALSILSLLVSIVGIVIRNLC